MGEEIRERVGGGYDFNKKWIGPWIFSIQIDPSLQVIAINNPMKLRPKALEVGSRQRREGR